MTKGHTTDSNWRRERTGGDERLSHPGLLRHEEKVLKPDSLLGRIDPAQAKFMRRAYY